MKKHTIASQPTVQPILFHPIPAQRARARARVCVCECAVNDADVTCTTASRFEYEIDGVVTCPCSFNDHFSGRVEQSNRCGCVCVSGQ